MADDDEDLFPPAKSPIDPNRSAKWQDQDFNISFDHLKIFPDTFTAPPPPTPTPDDFDSDNEYFDFYKPEGKSEHKNLFNFTLDLTRLNTAVLSVPFYKRYDFGKICFEEDEIERMEKEAAAYQNSNDSDSDFDDNLNTDELKRDKYDIKSNINDNKINNTSPIEETKNQIPSKKQMKKTVLESLDAIRSKEDKTGEDFSKWLDDFLTE